MTGKHLLASVAILLALAANSAFAAYDVNKYCQLVKIGTKFPSFDSCQTYYTCQSSGYTTSTCSSAESFDKDSQSCKASSTVSCYYGNPNPCATSSATYLPNPENCKGYIYCKNNVNSGTGVCPETQIWDASKSACVYGTCTNDQGTAIVTVDNLCEIMQSGAWFGDFEKCNVWHKCSSTTMTNGTCNAGLVFNTLKGMCLKDDGTMCTRVDNSALPPTEPCDTTLKGTYKGDSAVCSVYYQCDGTEWTELTCPTGQYFDDVSNTCQPRKTARATKGCNRCQYATGSWVNGVDPECRLYLTCNGGVETASGNCATDSYFDEQRQGCVASRADLETYADNNGACYNANDSDGGATTEAGGATTEADGATTEEGGATTEEGGATTEEGGATNEAGGATTVEGDATTEAGDATTEEGDATTEAAEATTEDEGA